MKTLTSIFKFSTCIQLLVVVFVSLYGQDALSQTSKEVPLVLDTLPLQLNSLQGETITLTFDQPIDQVLSRNLNVVNLHVDGNKIIVEGKTPGRTGLKITAQGKDYFVGYRVNHPDGTIPGMPDYLSVASVSEDSEADLAFWKDVHTGLTNKAMDIRYIYINGGPFTGWTQWGINRPEQFSTESLRHGLIPFFVYYNIPDSDEDFQIDSAHVNDPAYMTAYFNNLNLFLNKAKSVMQDELFGVILEPDFLGYIKQYLKSSPADQFVTCVALDTIAPGAGNVQTLVERINHTINQKKEEGYNIYFGWQLNLWSTPIEGINNVIRATDAMGYALGRKAIQSSAEQTALFGIKAGILSNDASFISIDKYGLDAGSVDTLDPANSTWFFNSDHWHNYLLFANTLYKSSGFPIILWQLPIGRINKTTTVSAYTNQPFPVLPDTTRYYEDSTPDFFLGDTFEAEDSLRVNYFSQNLYKDTTIQVHGAAIKWGEHMGSTAQSGIISTMFGAGVGASTSGIGNPPTDAYFWVQKVQEYYLNGVEPINWAIFHPCYGADSCLPYLRITYPIQDDHLVKSELEEMQIQLVAFHATQSLQTVKLTIQGNTIDLDPSGMTHTCLWTPPAYGTYTLIGQASDGTHTVTDTCTFSYLPFNPELCGIPLWHKDTAYTQAGNLVSWDGNIYKNAWWTQGEKPGVGAPTNNPWKYQQPCPVTLGTPEEPGASNTLTTAQVYPNPTKNSCNILLNNTLPGTRWLVNLKDIYGKEVIPIQRFLSRDRDLHFRLNLNGLKPGIYFLELNSDSQRIVKKVVIDGRCD